MNNLGKNVVEEILHISEKPWSDYSESDYTLQQWHNACIVHQHVGPPTAKSQCKLPVKTPGGALSRAGVHAAAAALAGARSPLLATPVQRAKAKAALNRYYQQLGETPPDSLTQSDLGKLLAEDILQHYGVLGMRWGHRKGSSTKLSNKQISRGLSERDLLRGHSSKDYEDARKDAKWLKKNFGHGVLSNLSPMAQVSHPIVKSIADTATKNSKSEFKALSKKPEFSSRKAKKAIKKYKGWLDPPDPIAKAYNKQVSEIYMKHVLEEATKQTGLSPSGKWSSEFHAHGKGSTGYWYVSVKSQDGSVHHSDIPDPDLAMLVHPIFDEEGYIIDIVPFDRGNDLVQSDIDNILSYHGSHKL